MALLTRTLRDPALAYDVAAEAFARARLEWSAAPEDDEAVAWLVELGAGEIEAAAQHGAVRSIERRRGGRTAIRRLTVARQQEITALAEQLIELPAAASDAASALARTAPAPSVLAGLRLSDLVQAAPLPDAGGVRHGL